MCLPLSLARAVERPAPAAGICSPVTRDYLSRALGGFFIPPRCDCSIKEREDVAQSLPEIEAIVLHNFCSAETGE